jgi:hypothetical protein
MRRIANMPGPGGSLGMCALCGDTFMAEILLGTNVQTVEIVGMDQDVCLHAKCLKVLEQNGPDWRTLPNGPLRRAYAKVNGVVEPQETDTVAHEHPKA